MPVPVLAVFSALYNTSARVPVSAAALCYWICTTRPIVWLFLDH